jgi:hypothetical protein
MKRYAAAIDRSDFDWSDAKLSCYGRDGCTGIGVIVLEYEHDLSLPLPGTDSFQAVAQADD